MRYLLTLRIVLFLCFGFVKSVPVSPRDTTGPVVTLRNGTYRGIYSSSYDQDFFLGIPYAQPPTGNLRFRNPVSLNRSWTGVKNTTEYSSACVGYGTSQIGYNVSEDCLYLNVIRPANLWSGPLPVLVWIHGGGFTQGGGTDLRYNMSFIVERSVEIGQPIMAVSINYRLSAWGFLSSDEVTASGHSNSKNCTRLHKHHLVREY